MDSIKGSFPVICAIADVVYGRLLPRQFRERASAEALFARPTEGNIEIDIPFGVGRNTYVYTCCETALLSSLSPQSPASIRQSRF
jgi:hypothetical protein